MNKVLICTLALMIVAVTAQAQTPLEMSGYIHFGVDTPMGPDELKDKWKTDIIGGAGIGMKVSPLIEVVIRGSSVSFALDEDEFLDATAFDRQELPDNVEVEVDGGGIKGFEIATDFKIVIPVGTSPLPFSPYALASLGLASSTVDDATVIATVDGAVTTRIPYGGRDKETDLTYGFGAGVDISISSSVSAFIQGKYMFVSAEGDDNSHLPLIGGLKISFGL